MDRKYSKAQYKKETEKITKEKQKMKRRKAEEKKRKEDWKEVKGKRLREEREDVREGGRRKE